MTTRYDVERAVEDSGLPPVSRHIVLVLCTRMQQGSTVILPQHSPSLTRLARGTGWSRRTIQRYLNQLEDAKWIDRIRPPEELARTLWMTTLYVVRIPDTLGSEVAGLGSEVAGLGSEVAGLGSEVAGLGSEVAANQICFSPETDREIDLVITELARHTGRTVSREHAAKVRDQVVNRPGVRNRMTYLKSTLRRTPERFLPSQADEPYCERCGQAGHQKPDCKF